MTDLTFRISEKHELTVLVSGDGNLFARLFQQAYPKLPQSARDRIEKMWGAIAFSPTITVEAARCLVTDNGKGHALAITEDEGHRIRFSGPAFEWVAKVKGEVAAESMIVHELAHVVSWAEKRVGALCRREEEAYEKAAVGDQAAVAVLEELADARMQKWGVDPKPIRAAGDEHLRIVEAKKK